jgi:hypothetical protein
MRKTQFLLAERRSTYMRKTLFMLALALLVAGVAMWNPMPVLADPGNTIMGDLHFQDIDIGEDYTYTLPNGITRAPGGYFATDAWDGQAALGNSVNFGGSSGVGAASQIIPYLQGANSGGSNWFYPCPIELGNIAGGSGAAAGTGGIDTTVGGVGGAMVNDVYTTDFPGCAAMVATLETESPQTNHVGLGNPDLDGDGLDENTNGDDVTFIESLYNFVAQNWVDYNVPARGGAEDIETTTYSGTLDQDLAQLFEYGGSNSSGSASGGGETGIPAGPYLGITQTLDQSEAYLEGVHTNPWPGAILDTSIRDLYGEAQRIVQTFSLENTAGRSDTGLQAEGSADTMHQWIADWMHSIGTQDDTDVGGDCIGSVCGGVNEDTLDGSVTWELETLFSESVLVNPDDTFIHQVNDQYSVYTASWSAGNSATSNPGNLQADMGQGNMVVGHSLSMEFWHAQTNTIPYDVSVSSFTSTPESVIGNFGTHDGDHNPINN